jgi:AP-4 complex subunit mu-1
VRIQFSFPKLGKPEKIDKKAADKPISVEDSKHHKNEIFVDIIERISVTFNSNGYPTQSEIDGCIQMKSYLSGNPELRMALNEELVIGKSAKNQYGALIVDDCNFHECVRLNEFEQGRVVSFVPPDGEFAAMNYRITTAFRAPFRIFPFVDVISPYKVEVTIKLRADIPEQNYGSNMVIEIPLPKGATGCAHDWGSGAPPAANGHVIEYDNKEKKVTWNVKKFPGGKEYSLRLKLSMANPVTATIRKEVGPITLTFDIPMYNVSGLQVRYLRILETSKAYNPYRWVRYITKSSSYVCRV